MNTAVSERDTQGSAQSIPPTTIIGYLDFSSDGTLVRAHVIEAGTTEAAANDEVAA